ncbi:MAG TPA: creatininase family protein [Gammaproteobacteria bacterium]|nr:creatininase family protein [Gammaproteobacteria bacterium]
MHSGYWQDCTTADFARVDPEQTVALLPVAAVEQHGAHLPLATDAIINEGLVRAALALQPATPALLVLPAMNVGLSTEHVAFPGTLTVADHTLADAWTDVGRSVARAGVRKLIILNTHGGQKSLVDLVAVRLRAEQRMLVVRATYFAFGSPPGLFAGHELAHDIHGGEVETSLLLHLRPDLVRTAALADFRGLPHELAARHQWLGAEKPVGFGWLSGDLHPAGVCGNAALADAKRGAAQLAHLAAALVRLVGEVAATPLSILR